MPVDPFLEPLLSSLAPLPERLDLPNFRREYELRMNSFADQLAEAGPAIEDRREVTIPVADGGIDLVIYKPFADAPLPVHLYIHGGGSIAGSAKQKGVEIIARERAAGAGCVVVAADYRKAPEHKYPTALNDCYAALLWIVQHADELSARSDLITVGGESFGANLAAALTLKVRDEGGPQIAFQLLEIPPLDRTCSLPAHTENATGYGLTEADIQRLLGYYLGSRELARDPYVSPLLAADLSDLPPTHIMSAEFDPLRDDGATYAERLNAAGVPATFTLGLGHIHGSGAFTKVMASARDWRDEAVAALRRAHRKAASPQGPPTRPATPCQQLSPSGVPDE